MRRAARARLLSVGRLLLFGRRLLGRQSWSAAVGGVEPRHRFPEVADARVAAAVAAALEEADEVFHRVFLQICRGWLSPVSVHIFVANQKVCKLDP